ncbi:MAG TPA: LysM peptidoglycan-binding domain-containing protein [Anaerolineae bacterium]|nr:LysM peptidoglycan-binding domain-containing protein [Anaerolineae bacterium]
MNKKIKMPMLIGLLVLTVILAGCDRPSADNPLTDTTANTQSLADVSAQQTADAIGADNQAQPEGTSPAGTALPPVQPQATDAPVPTAIPAQSTSAPATTSGPAQSTPGPSTTSTSTCGATYIVQPGDRFFSIGRACNVNPYAIAQANNIGAPYFIYPGQQLIIPGGNPGPQPTTTPGGNTYVVQPGDNLFRIALQFGKTMQAIAAANGLSNINLIFVGQRLTIP